MPATPHAQPNTLYSEPLGLSVNDRLRVDWIGLTERFGKPGTRRHVPFHGLSLFLQGNAMCTFGDRRPFRVIPPAALLSRAGHDQAVAGETGQPWRSRYALLTGVWVDDWIRFGWWPEDYRVIPLHDPDSAEAMHQRLLEAVATQTRRDLESAKSELLHWVCKLALSDPTHARSRVEMALDALVQGWREKPEAPVDLRDTARELGMSYSLFREVFRKRFHTSPYEYHLRLRLDRGRTLLGETDLLVKQIALHTGFRNVETFQRHFVKRVGLSPARYRRQIRALALREATP